MSDWTQLAKPKAIKFFKGQLLHAADLNEAWQVLRDMRWLHNSSLHNWGIALGLKVKGDNNKTQVQVSEGYALDALGRELILNEAQNLNIPTVAALGKDPQAFWLVISFEEDNHLVTAKGEGICHTDGSIQILERPCLRWLRSDAIEYRHGLDLILAQVWVKNCRLVGSLSLQQRRYTRVSQKPYFASGQTTGSWEIIQVGNDIGGYSTWVDTKEAHFRSTPVYQAQVMGRYLMESNPLHALAGLTEIREATAQGFRLNIFLPQGYTLPGNVPLNPVDKLNNNTPTNLEWQVQWMGVEGG